MPLNEPDNSQVHPNYIPGKTSDIIDLYNYGFNRHNAYYCSEGYLPPSGRKTGNSKDYSFLNETYESWDSYVFYKEIDVSFINFLKEEIEYAYIQTSILYTDRCLDIDGERGCNWLKITGSLHIIHERMKNNLSKKEKILVHGLYRTLIYLGFFCSYIKKHNYNICWKDIILDNLEHGHEYAVYVKEILYYSYNFQHSIDMLYNNDCIDKIKELESKKFRYNYNVQMDGLDTIFHFKYLLPFGLPKEEMFDIEEWACIPCPPVKRLTYLRFKRAVGELLQENEVNPQLPSIIDTAFFVKDSASFKKEDMVYGNNGPKRINLRHLKKDAIKPSSTPFVFQRAYVYKNPAESRDAVIPSVEDREFLTTFNFIMMSILKDIPQSLMGRKRIKIPFQQNVPTEMFIELDFRKDGWTKPRWMVQAVCEVLEERFPNFFDWMSFSEKLNGSSINNYPGRMPIIPERGYMLGMANALATFINIAILKTIGYDQFLVMNDDIIIKSKVEAVFDEETGLLYNKNAFIQEFLSTRDAIKSLDCILHEKKRVISNSVRICEEYFNANELWNKSSEFVNLGTLFLQRNMFCYKTCMQNFLNKTYDETGFSTYLTYDNVIRKMDIYKQEFIGEQDLPFEFGGLGRYSISNLNTSLRYMFDHGTHFDWVFLIDNKEDLLNINNLSIISKRLKKKTENTKTVLDDFFLEGGIKLIYDFDDTKKSLKEMLSSPFGLEKKKFSHIIFDNMEKIRFKVLKRRDNIQPRVITDEQKREFCRFWVRNKKTTYALPSQMLLNQTCIVSGESLGNVRTFGQDFTVPKGYSLLDTVLSLQESYGAITNIPHKKLEMDYFLYLNKMPLGETTLWCNKPMYKLQRKDIGEFEWRQIISWSKNDYWRVMHEFTAQYIMEPVNYNMGFELLDWIKPEWLELMQNNNINCYETFCITAGNKSFIFHNRYEKLIKSIARKLPRRLKAFILDFIDLIIKVFDDEVIQYVQKIESCIESCIIKKEYMSLITKEETDFAFKITDYHSVNEQDDKNNNEKHIKKYANLLEITNDDDGESKGTEGENPPDLINNDSDEYIDYTKDDQWEETGYDSGNDYEW